MSQHFAYAPSQSKDSSICEQCFERECWSCTLKAKSGDECLCWHGRTFTGDEVNALQDAIVDLWHYAERTELGRELQRAIKNDLKERNLLPHFPKATKTKKRHK